MTYLAQHPEPGFQLARAMALELGLPGPYLAKLLQPLVARGLLESRRGRSGGFRLARTAESLTLYEIVDAQEGLGGPRQCLLGQSACGDDRACPLHEFWKRASDGFRQRLASTCLADLVRFCEREPDSGYPGLSAKKASARPARKRSTVRRKR